MDDRLLLDWRRVMVDALPDAVAACAAAIARMPIDAFFLMKGDGRLSSSSRLYLGPEPVLGKAAASEASEGVEAEGNNGGAVAVRDIG